jgi:hypothetical protein
MLGYMPRGYIGAIKTDAKEAFKAGAMAVKVSEKGSFDLDQI